MIGVERIIEKLGFSGSASLYYSNSIDIKSNRSISKLFKELGAYALYTANEKPFILFYESTVNCITSQLIKKVWNAQIPLVIISFSNRIEVYNGCSIDKNKNLIQLGEINADSIDQASPFSFWRITDPAFWQEFEHEMSAPKLDTVLLDNIRETTERLRKKPCSPFAVKLVLRLIFIRYLIDRGVDFAYQGLNGSVEESQSHLLETLRDKTKLYDLFAYLKSRFNGNLFELFMHGNTPEFDLLDNDALKILYDLLSGNLIMASGQMSLFPMYDFNIIPVELISSIYERFLGVEKQNQEKAFYTPPFLVSYILEQTITPFLVNSCSCKILDPACGSGIFLVESARQLIERRIAQCPDSFSDRVLVETITENLWGVDKNPEAIDVAIFSIYLTLLDYKDPKTLKSFTLPLLENQNLFVCDFFSSDIEKHLGGIPFDFIIGNPPWGNVEGLHVSYCKEHNYPIYRNEISRSFMLRTKDFSASHTCCCLIVTSKLFYNKKSPAVAFRKWLLEQAKIDTYIELAPVREMIFAKARGPAGIIIYKFGLIVEENIRHEMCHLTLKPNIFFKLFNIIGIEKNDYKFMQQASLLNNDWVWKTLVFGYTYDFRLIKSLNKKYPTVMQIIERSNLKSGTGIRVAEGDKQDASHLTGRWLIDAEKGIQPFIVAEENGKVFDKKRIHRAKKDKPYLFNSPYVLVKKGFNTKNYRFRAAYSEADFLYTDAITGICGEQSDSDALMSLTGLINSSFYAYLNLMLGSSSGIEREQGFPTEIFSYPAIMDTHISDLVQQIIHTLKCKNEYAVDPQDENRLVSMLDSFILDQFGILDNAFINYALNIQIPLIANNKVAWEKVNNDQLREYASVFTEYFLSVMQYGDKHVLTNIYRKVAGHYSAVEFIFLDSEPDEIVVEHDCAKDNVMDVESKFMVNKLNERFYQMKDIISFSENSFYIIKPDEYRNWHPAMAQLDLSDVLDSILLGNKEGT